MHPPRRTVPSLDGPPRARPIARPRLDRRSRPILPIGLKEDNECKRGRNRKGQRLRAREQTMVANGRSFQLGFNSPGETGARWNNTKTPRLSSISMRSNETFHGWRIALKL